MSETVSGVVARAEDRPRERWDDQARGNVTWFTLFSRDLTPTAGMSAGIAEIVPGNGSLQLHRHAQPELYFVFEGNGILTIDGVETAVSAGSAVFIPGDAEHGIRNESAADLKLFYVFATDRFSDVVYRFPE